MNIPRKKIHNKNVLITGSTSGIGKKAALTLGRLGANVYIHGRNVEEGNKISNKLKKEIGTKSKFFKSDLSKIQEVNATVELVKEEIDHLDILINNAGEYMKGDKTGTNNMEYTFCINYLSRFILTLKLMSYLDSTDSTSNIIYTVSSSHKNINDFNFNSVNNSKNNWEAYSRANLANVLLSIYLARNLNDENIAVNTVHPGIIPSSNFLRNMPKPINELTTVLSKIPLPGLCSQSKGSATLINPISKEYSGSYYNQFNRERPSRLAQNTALQDNLWDYSIKKTNLDRPDLLN